MPLLWKVIHAQGPCSEVVTLWGPARDLEGTKGTPTSCWTKLSCCIPLASWGCSPVPNSLMNLLRKVVTDWVWSRRKKGLPSDSLIERELVEVSQPCTVLGWPRTKLLTGTLQCLQSSASSQNINLSFLSKPPAPLQPNSQALHCTFSLKLLSIHKDRYLQVVI